jgi:hypothetical protein
LNSTGLHLNLSGSQLLQSSFKLAIARWQFSKHERGFVPNTKGFN